VILPAPPPGWDQGWASQNNSTIEREWRRFLASAGTGTGSGDGPSGIEVVANESIPSGAFVYIMPGSSPVRIALASADVEDGAATADGYVLVGGDSSATVTMYFSGINTALSGLLTGSVYVLSVGGGVTPLEEIDETTGYAMQLLGRAVSTTALSVEISYPELMA
jgi:hypothetical protein